MTKSLQTHGLDARTTLTDTPGLMWPKIDNAEDGLMLAALNAIGRNAILEEEVAEHLAVILLARYPAQLAERYGLTPAGLDGYGALEAIARKRGCLKPGQGGTLDLEKAALILLTEFRAGTLGRISLELPTDRSRG